MLLVLLRLAFAGPAPLAAPLATLADGPPSARLDLWRAYADADKVFVSVGLPDGSDALFLLDTGASISVVNRDVIERLDLPVAPVEGGVIEGLSGSVGWMQATLPDLRLGDHHLRDVVVAVDVPGTPENAGPLEVAGILGNNVWANFTCVVDYPADVLELWRPDTYRMPGRGAPLYVEELHPLTEVGIVAADGTRARVILEVDTGARDVLLFGGAGEAFRESSTRGLEAVFGIGASLDDLPLQSFLRDTRRVPITRVDVGGRRVKLDARARWYEADGERAMRTTLPGLLGFLPFADRRLVLDFPGERIWVGRSAREARDFDAVGAALAKESARGTDPARAAIRARLQIAAGDLDAARATIDAGLAALPHDAELAGLLAAFRRNDGDLAGAVAALAPVPPAALAEEGLWGSYVNGIALAGDPGRARLVAEEALGAAPEDDARLRSDLLVALSDALLADGRPGEASAAIQEATQLSPGGSAHLLRKARVALAEGDRYGAIVALRDLAQLYPIDGTPLWLYATLAQPGDRPTFLADLDAALGRLHPGDEPWDFVGAALIAAGQRDRGLGALRTGEARDCAPMPAGPDRDNCEAWYWALAGERLEEAEAKVEAALTARPWSAAFHDTAGMVARARGSQEEAHAHALRAAALSPDDPYLLWQVAPPGATLPPVR